MTTRKVHWIDGEPFIEYEGEKRPSTERKATKEEKKENERRWCLRALGERWLPHNVRNAILKELKVPPRRYDTDNQDLRASVERQLVKARKEAGMPHEAAVDEVAGLAKVKPSALKQRNTRARRRARNRAATKN
jgi:hypothetical protein